MTRGEAGEAQGLVSVQEHVASQFYCPPLRTPHTAVYATFAIADVVALGNCHFTVAADSTHQPMQPAKPVTPASKLG